ncbi:putative tetratricopeptide-like helical domain superfamily [Helianthus annuus]|nr:putative tetratricopeptide-like helical domain superfamily [Helianthus annuus]
MVESPLYVLYENFICLFDYFHQKGISLLYVKLLFDGYPEKDDVCWNSMIDAYVKAGEMELARLVFDEMPCRDDAVKMFRDMPRRDVVSWNAMLACYAQNGKSNEALSLFDEIKVAGVRANEATVVSVLSEIGQLGGLDQGLQLHICTSMKMA